MYFPSVFKDLDILSRYKNYQNWLTYMEVTVSQVRIFDRTQCNKWK